MKKRLFILLLLFIAILIAGCSDEGDASSTETSNEDDKTEGTEPSGTGPLIDPDHALDERQSIIMTVEDQKERLKLGFITEDMTLDSIYMHRFMDKEFAEADQSTYASTYRSESPDRGIHYSNEIWACEDGLDEWTSDLEYREEFKDDQVEGYYGHYEYETSNLAVKHQDECYIATIYGEDDEYDEADEGFLELMSKTFKTEEEGAYDPVYSRFTIDLDNIKFPSLNENRATLRGTWLSYNESKLEPNYSVVGADYFIEDDHLTYEITDEEELYATVKTEEDLQTENGITVTKVEENVGFEYKYIWNDGTYNYVIKVDKEAFELPESELLEIVDSAMADERSFDNLDFFSGVTKTPELGKEAQELIDTYY